MLRNRKGRRIGLGTKLDVMLVTCILLISLGLAQITYTVYCRKVNSIYMEKAERAASALADKIYFGAYYIQNLRDLTDTDEFRQVHANAVVENDEKIIEDWMMKQPPGDDLLDRAIHDQFEPDEEYTGQEYMKNDGRTLYDDYQDVLASLETAKDLLGVNSAYIQYVVDGVTYNLADPDESLFIVGTAEVAVEAFAHYTGNDRVPATIYQFKGDMLCTACEPYEDGWYDDKQVVAQVGVDIFMNEVAQERHWFLVNSAAFIAVLTLAAMVASILLTRRLATKPLRQLAEGATGFDVGEEGFTGDDEIRLPIKSNDEIGDLYHEIQSMQQRIVDNTERLTKATAERERVNTELGMATQIQASALPKQFPNRAEFDLSASMDPAKEVGGDFYDCFLVDDDHLALVIADVSDKGVPAALFMMSAKSIIRYRAQMGGSPGEILTSANAQLCKNNYMKMFVTVWMGILEISTGRLTCTNAGHEYPVIRGQDGTFRVFQDRHGVMVGTLSLAKYRDYTLTLMPGDAIFVYTDGVPEAQNAAKEMYGMKRLEAALNRTRGETPEGILRAVRADVDAFVNGAKQFDDLTMLCLEYRG